MANKSGESERSSSELSDSDGGKDKYKDASKPKKHKKSKHSKKKSKKKSSKRKRHRDRSRSKSKEHHKAKRSDSPNEKDKTESTSKPQSDESISKAADVSANVVSANQDFVLGAFSIKPEPKSLSTVIQSEAPIWENGPYKVEPSVDVKSEPAGKENLKDNESNNFEIYDPGLYIGNIKDENDLECTVKENKSGKDVGKKSKSRFSSRESLAFLKKNKPREKSNSIERKSEGRRSRFKERRSKSRERRSKSRERRSKSRERRSKSKKRRSMSKEKSLKSKHGRSKSRERRSKSREIKSTFRERKSESKDRRPRSRKRRSKSRERRSKSKDIRSRSRERRSKSKDRRSRSREGKSRSKERKITKGSKERSKEISESRKRSKTRSCSPKKSTRSSSHQKSSRRSKSKEHRRSRSTERHRFAPRFQNYASRQSRSNDRRYRSRSRSIGRRRLSRSHERDRRSRSRERRRRSRSRSNYRGRRSRSKNEYRSRSPRKSSRDNDRRKRSKSQEAAAASVPVNLTIALGAPTTSVTTTTAITKPSKSIADFTALCKKLSEAKEEEKNEIGESEVNGENVTPVYHPFSVKPAKDIVIPPVILPVSKPAGPPQRLEQAFPVSSGNQHKTKESTNDAVVEGVDGSVAAAEKVFQTAAQQEKLDVSSLIAKRMEAQNRLQSNPNDYEARLMLEEIQMKIQNWASVNLKPGQYTGESLVSSLVPKENINSGYQAWAKKDMFHNLAPIRGGVGMKLLQKMGWKPGQILGKRGEGSYEPIALNVKTDRRGLVSCAEAGVKGKGGGKGGGKNILAAQAVQGKHPVSALAELCTKRRWKMPTYNVVHESGPAHKKDFLYEVIVNGNSYQHNIASNNKKLAKAEAAFAALKALGVVPADAAMTL